MPISFGTSTMVISLPDLSAAPAALPPSNGLAASGVAAPPASQPSGLVGRSSAPSHLPAAFAPPAVSDKANIAAAVVVSKLTLMSILPRCRSQRRWCLRMHRSVSATLKGTRDQNRENERDPNDDDCPVPLDAR